MGKTIFFSYNLDPGWDIVKKIREQVEAAVSKKNEDLGYASKMATSELIENAIKYGCAVDDEKGVQYDLSLSDKELTITVTNGIRSEEDLKNVSHHIDQINARNNPQELYIERLTELLENPKSGQSQLGLYRVAYEGKFNLSYKYENNIITVIAVRNI